jgi:hypothetical protein
LLGGLENRPDAGSAADHDVLTTGRAKLFCAYFSNYFFHHGTAICQSDYLPNR